VKKESGTRVKVINNADLIIFGIIPWKFKLWMPDILSENRKWEILINECMHSNYKNYKSRVQQLETSKDHLQLPKSNRKTSNNSQIPNYYITNSPGITYLHSKTVQNYLVLPKNS
jgi:hypothetical protein